MYAPAIASGIPVARDPHRFINDLDNGDVERLVDRLESRARDEVFMRPFNAYAARLALFDAPMVLEVGCGTGAIARAIARRDGFEGSITGVDQSPAMVDHATRLAHEAGLGSELKFEVHDAHDLEFEDGTFDIVIAHTLMSHVTDPKAVTVELARVVRQGGTVVVFDGDYASLTFAHADEELGRSMDRAIARATFNNRLVMRAMPDLLRHAGLELDVGLAEVVSEIGHASFFRSFAETYAPNVKTAGLVEDAQVDEWVSAQRQAMDEGRFFGACNYYTYLARKL